MKIYNKSTDSLYLCCDKFLLATLTEAKISSCALNEVYLQDGSTQLYKSLLD